jgi:hypothetical protein
MPRPSSLTDAAIRDILTSYHISHKEMGRRYSRAHQTISQVRFGQVHANRLPELPRWVSGRTCEQCQHWVSRCDLGFPDPIEEGIAFAQQCSCFKEAS